MSPEVYFDDSEKEDDESSVSGCECERDALRSDDSEDERQDDEHEPHVQVQCVAEDREARLIVPVIS